MAIYRLNEITDYIRGGAIFQKKDLSDKGDFIALHYGKTYKVNKVTNDFNYFCNKSFYKENQVVTEGDVVLVSTSETINDLGHVYFYENMNNGLLGGEQILLKPNNKVINKYLYYWLFKNKGVFSKFATGISVFRFKGSDFKYIEIDLPIIQEQQKIIDIIEPKEDLFIKYSNTVRINSFDICKGDLEKLIDIIEPIETLLYKLSSLYKKVYSLIEFNQNNKISDFVISKSNGYAYSKNDYKEDGEYNVFKTKNILSKDFDKTNLVKNNILPKNSVVTGLSGTIGTAKVINDGKYVNNQRTLSLETKYPYHIKRCIEKNKNKLINVAHGAAQLNIKALDILELDFGVKDIDFSLEVNILLSKNELLISKLTKIRDKLVMLLIK